jgi:hypothetical protein
MLSALVGEFCVSEKRSKVYSHTAKIAMRLAREKNRKEKSTPSTWKN